MVVNGRGDWIRTSDFSLPKRALYQAELRPESDRSNLTRPAPCSSPGAMCRPPAVRWRRWPAGSQAPALSSSGVARYFVTGATGFVGAEVAKQLLSRGHQVAALVRDPAKASLLAKLGAELHAGDITAPETLRAPMQGADGVFHIAAWYKTGHPRALELATAVNVGGTRNVLGAMRDLGIRKGVYTSTLAVNSDTHGMLVDETVPLQRAAPVGLRPDASGRRTTRWRCR